MRHFTGGFALGFAFGLCFIEKGEHKPTQCTALALLAGVAAWGLLS